MVYSYNQDEERGEVSMKEVIEMTRMLLGMSTDTYLECKYILMAVSMEHKGKQNFINELFRFTDKHRPLLIEMKIGCTE